jgi:hypothetical protein
MRDETDDTCAFTVLYTPVATCLKAGVQEIGRCQFSSFVSLDGRKVVPFSNHERVAGLAVHLQAAKPRALFCA